MIGHFKVKWPIFFSTLKYAFAYKGVYYLY